MENKQIQYQQAYLDAKKRFAEADKNFDANPSKKTAKILSDARRTLSLTPKYSKEDQDMLDLQFQTEISELLMVIKN